MHPKVPAITFGIAIALTAGVAVWYAFVGRNASTVQAPATVPTAQAPVPEQSASVATGTETAATSTTAAADTSDWKTYNEPSLGLEMKYPKELSISPSIGPDPGNEFEFWRDIVGRIYLSTEFWDKSGDNVNFDITIKRSKLPLEEFVTNRGIGVSEGGTTTIAGLPAWKDGLAIYQIDYNKNFGFNERRVIKNGDVYYFFNFDGSSITKEAAELLRHKWDAIISSARFTQIVK